MSNSAQATGREQLYEDMQVRLERNEYSLSGKYHKMNRLINSAKETSDRDLDKAQRRKHQQRSVAYNKRHVDEQDFTGVYQ